ncbi:pyridoxal phosphate-dependent aminotransferase [Treponema brennaborense]|uniref:Histidinol-phosphate transaminase n=1 Tax=Treponema brennaborense (strain DSM 12168 / CIP 105900 / DD5/3) TaxID=906968 RepID=F4LPR5_TREBD|nr:histidinol-phosphate transaminase [Treponema brennaborense]AEE17061.1 Histidinol-phosphate transaminase [Treponema brennaborense DSM 12168]
MYYINPVIKDFIRTNQPENRGGYIRLDQNENPDGLPKWLFKKAIKRITPSYLSLYPEEIEFTAKYAHLLGLKYENITLTDGSVVAMGYVVKVFGESRKKLLCVTPTFGMYKVYADMQQMETEFVHYKDDYTFNIDELIKRIDERTSLISLVNPNMPIGNVYLQEDIIRVIEKAKEVNAMVIIDEAYHYFYEKSSINLIDRYDNLIILRTFSKFLSIPGLRMGAVISNQKNIQYVKNYKPHYTVNNVALTFGETIVDNFDRLYGDLQKKFKDGKKALLKALDEAAYSYIPTEGCFICIRPKHKTAEYITEELKKQNILIFCGKGDSAGFLRVTIWDRKYMKLFISTLLEIDIEN